jgi:hypothetical protein
MSLRPEPIEPVPAETARVARAAFPRDGRVTADEDATPDQGTDGTEDDAELIHAGFRRCRQAGHPAIVPPIGSLMRPPALFPTLLHRPQ